MRIYLRELNRIDLPIINSWRNDREVIGYLGSNFLYITQEIDNKWYENYLNNRSNAVRLAIVDLNNNNTLVGTAQLTNIHQVNRNAEFSILLGNKDYWSKGVGMIAASEILKHGFNDLNLYRIYLTVLEDNERAIGLYEKLGFKTEGILRGAVYKEGEYKNMRAMSILKDDI